MAAPVAKVEINEESFRQAEQLLTRLPIEMRTGIIPKAVRAAASPVVGAARRFAPDSVKTGSRKHWSSKVRSQRQGVPQHKDTIGKSTVRQYRGGEIVAIYVGALWPAGVLINVIGHEHAEMWWGKPTGRRLPGHKYLEQAGASTAAEQQAAFVGTVAIETEKILSKK